MPKVKKNPARIHCQGYILPAVDIKIITLAETNGWTYSQAVDFLLTKGVAKYKGPQRAK